MSWNDGKFDVLFGPLRKYNVERCERHFHRVKDWSAQRWALCVCGEVGEVINAVKKIWRCDGTPEAVGAECADVLIYFDLLLHRQGRGVLCSSNAARVWLPDGAARFTLDEHDLINLQEASFYMASEARTGTSSYWWTTLVIRTTRVMQAMGLDPAEEIVKKFDLVSERVGFTRRLADLAGAGA